MPLFELLDENKGKSSAAKEKKLAAVSADQSLPTTNKLVELIWQNGQVMMQGQSSRPQQNHSPSSSYSLPSNSPKREKDLSSAPYSSPSLKFRTLESGLNEFLMSPSLGEMDLSSDDDIVPWFDYQMDEAPETDFCSSFLPRLSGVVGNETSQKDFNTTKRGAYTNDVCGKSNVSSMYSSLAVVSESTRSGASHNPAGQAQFPSLRPRNVCENTGKSTSTHSVGKDLSRITNSVTAFSGQALKKQNPGHSINCNDLQNFSHFVRSVALCKSIIENNRIADSGPSDMERAGSGQKDYSSDVKAVKSNSSPIGESKSHWHIVDKQETGSGTSSKAKPTEDLSFKGFKGIGHECVAKCDKQNNEDDQKLKCTEHQDAVEPLVGSSICSGNGIDSISDDPPSHLKRKASSSNHDFEAPIDDVEEDSVGLRKPSSARGSSSKRSRASEVHNLSERVRKMRFLKVV
ncbi:hypothetical protein SAY86_015631 [Trapa natans]|uniref:Uncharacterized protein n=1 Tax=Trapa natans TaxID=22666 RepID=A0AAN7LCB8_TRANT|nr:hypothetical protein SAY86_015631 [Trapa natans]